MTGKIYEANPWPPSCTEKYNLNNVIIFFEKVLKILIVKTARLLNPD